MTRINDLSMQQQVESLHSVKLSNNVSSQLTREETVYRVILIPREGRFKLMLMVWNTHRQASSLWPKLRWS